MSSSHNLLCLKITQRGLKELLLWATQDYNGEIIIYIGKVTPKHLIYLLLRVINLTEVTFTLPYDIFQ